MLHHLLQEGVGVFFSYEDNCPSKIFRLTCNHWKLIDFHLLFWEAQQRLFAVLDVLTSMFKTSAQLRLENLAFNSNCF